MLSSLPCRCGSVLALVLVCAPLLPGCAKQEFQNLRQATFPVRGQVTLDGKPVANATIVFKPVDASKFKWREQPQAKSDAEGKFTLFTYEANDGAPTGDYRVGIAILAAAEEGADGVGEHVVEHLAPTVAAAGRWFATVGACRSYSSMWPMVSPRSRSTTLQNATR